MVRPGANRTARRLGARLLTMAVVGLAVGACAVDVPEAKWFIDTHCNWRVPLVDPANDFQIAAILSMTKLRKDNPDGVARTQAMELALEEINGRQGIGGGRFGLRVCDTTETGAGEMGKLDGEYGDWLAEAGVQAFISATSADTMEIHSRTKARDALVMAFTATSMDITHLADNGLVWRTSASDEFQGAVMARALAQRGAKKVTALHGATSYGDSLAKALRDAAGTLDVETYSVGRTNSDVAKALTTADARGADWVVVMADAAIGTKILNLLPSHKSLSGAKLLLCDALHKVSVLGGLLDSTVVHGALGTLPGNPTGPVFDAFAKNYKLRFGGDATQLSFTAHAYDAMYTVLLAHAWALKDDPNAAVTGSALAQGMTKLSAGDPIPLEPASFAKARGELLAGKSINVQGASGSLDFDPKTGEAPSAVELWEVNADLSFKTLGWVKATYDGKTWKYEDLPVK